MSTRTLRLEAAHVGKRYGSRWVLERLSLSLELGETLVVAGPNGAGKSTLLRLLAGLEQPSSGAIRYTIGAETLTPPQARQALGLVAPDVRLYRELTALEHLRLFADLRGIVYNQKSAADLLERVGLAGRGDDRVGSYSSGMNLRLKYALMLLHQPAFLLLDEPTAMLDSGGRALVGEIVAEQRRRGIVVLATNDRRELDLGDYVLNLGHMQESLT